MLVSIGPGWLAWYATGLWLTMDRGATTPEALRAAAVVALLLLPGPLAAAMTARRTRVRIAPLAAWAAIVAHLAYRATTL